ncbi:NAD kinase 1 [Mesoplasma lactucae ATCC 49193]|uniref:NAD kinase n=2 Tax=Mesoplasma lactucae TaxID=138853 RepID=A0A291IR20_9MOLU|nr:NAD(+) kinase [Mesoplasma lactucae ATCC 49193]ATZ20316.1 inorganic polyphosphate/ATP-NAD kinase [Mesoplasma lactucae ATCC 49193]MCL8216487.1 NAD kinase 1 [Mesoplasma lactucae ATCC 49193]
MKYSIIANDYPESLELVKTLNNELKNDNDLTLDDKNPELVFVIGGDGTFLKAINKYNNQLEKIRFYPIKKGGIGFYTNHNIVEDDNDVKKILAIDKCKHTYEYPLLEVKIDDKTIYTINEAKILNDISPQQLDIYINDEKLESFKGSGLVFSTPSGTTGFMKSVGGAIIYPNLDLFEMQEISPVSTVIFKTINSPIIFSKEQVIKIKNSENLKDKDNLKVISDAKQIATDFKEAKISLSNKKVRIIATKMVDRTTLLKDIFVINK